MSKAGGSTMTPRIQHPAGIPDVLHLGEQPQPVCSVHAAKQFRARPPVAVLAGDRAAQCHDEIRRLLDERPECRQAARTEQIEIDPHVHAALAEVAVIRSGQSVPTEQIVEAAQVVTETLGWNRRILPAAPGLGAVGPAGREARRVRAASPQHALRLRDR